MHAPGTSVVSSTQVATAQPCGPNTPIGSGAPGDMSTGCNRSMPCSELLADTRAMPPAPETMKRGVDARKRGATSDERFTLRTTYALISLYSAFSAHEIGAGIPKLISTVNELLELERYTHC